MIQDIFPKKLDNHYDPEIAPLPEDAVLSFDDQTLALMSTPAGQLRFPTIEEWGRDRAFTFLFSIDDRRYFLLPEPSAPPEGIVFIETRSLRRTGGMAKAEIFAALTGKHLYDWYRDTQFCGRCGSPMIHSERERAMFCPICRKNFYPRIMPAVIVGVVNGDKLLLTKYRTGFKYNALIAGFTEIGETAEETVAREVMEEAGIHVKNIRYYKSQPWGIANDLLLGFYCDLDGDPEIHMDTEELKYAQWVKREEIELQPDDFSLTNEMMYQFKIGNAPR